MDNYLKKHSYLIKEWDYEKNRKEGITPDNLPCGSNTSVWWIGICGHSWKAQVKERARGYGCPICAGKRVEKGVNDLKALFPNIAEEWDFKRNGGLQPDEITPKSHKKVWWICNNNHEYEASIDSRTRGRKCPYCASKKVLIGFNDLETKFPEIAEEWDYKRNDGLCPCDVLAQSHKKVWWKCSVCDSEWSSEIYSRIAGNGCPYCAKRLQSSFPEQALYYYVHKCFPDAINRYKDIFNNAMELDIYIPCKKIGIEYDGRHWHDSKESKEREKKKYDICKDKGIKLIRIKEESDLLDYLVCDNLVQISDNLDETINKVLGILNSPLAVNTKKEKKLILSNYTLRLKDCNLEIEYPDIAKEWHPTKNEILQPDMFTPHSDLKAWWLCSNNHEYQSTIAHRVDGSNCPYCSNRKLLIGYNDFETTNSDPKLLSEWDYKKNKANGLTPNSIIRGSKKKVWWKCDKGHSWQTTISERIRGSGCPVCSGRVAEEGVNDLASQKPELAKEWNYKKNNGLLPTMVTVFSNKKVWWKCGNCQYEWKAMIEIRSRGGKCPQCKAILSSTLK